VLATYTTRQRTELVKTFQRMNFCLSNCHNSIQNQTKANTLALTINIGKTMTPTTVGLKVYHRHIYTQFCNKHNINISLMLTDRYLKTTLQLKFRNNFELASVLTEILNISVKTEYWNSVGELMSEFSLPKRGSICRINNTICRFLRAVTRSFEVTDRYLTTTMQSLWHLF
jgi:hypothetical protein